MPPRASCVSASCPAPAPSRFLGAGLHLNQLSRFRGPAQGEASDDEALIRNTVIALNFVDVYYRRASLPVPAFPAIIGDEAAGVVEAVGKNVKNVSVGDRVVYGDIAFGAYATARLHPADRLVRIPAGVSEDQAA